MIRLQAKTSEIAALCLARSCAVPITPSSRSVPRNASLRGSLTETSNVGCPT